MRKGLKQLVEMSVDKKIGNHRVEILENGRKFFLYSTCICETNDNRKTFKIDASYGTQTTTQAVNGYKEHFKSNGYQEVSEF